MSGAKLKFKPSAERDLKNQPVRSSGFKLKAGGAWSWLPDYKVGFALVFGLINFGTGSGLVFSRLAGKIYSGYLVLGFFTLLLVSIPLGLTFCVLVIPKLMRSLRASKNWQDLVWLIISCLSLFSALLVLLRGLSLVTII